VTQFRKKPVVIEAWTVEEINAAFARDYWSGLPYCIREAYGKGGWVPGALRNGRGIFVPTLEGSVFAAPGDWIIRGVAGEFYPIKPDIFEATYEPVDPPREGE
jgi:hypothetical protein